MNNLQRIKKMTAKEFTELIYLSDWLNDTTLYFDGIAFTSAEQFKKWLLSESLRESAKPYN